MLKGDAGDFPLWSELVQPDLSRRPRNGAHDAISKALGLDFTSGFYQTNGGINRRVWLHAGIKNLIGAQAQGINHGWGNILEAARRALCDDGINYAKGAQRAVGDFGGKGGIAPLELLLAQRLGQNEVGKSIILAYPAHHVEGDRTRRIHARGQRDLNQTAFLALAGTLVPSSSLPAPMLPTAAATLLPLLAATAALRTSGFVGVLRLARRRLIPGLAAGTETTTH